MNAKNLYGTAVFKADESGPYTRPDADFPTAAIGVNSWDSRIEVHGEDEHRAEVLRDYVLDAIHLKQRQRNPEPVCVITGCALFLDGSWVAADLFDAGDFWLVNANTRDRNEVEWFNESVVAASYSKRITIVAGCPFWERRGVFIIHKSCAVLNQAAIDYIK